MKKSHEGMKVILPDQILLLLSSLLREEVKGAEVKKVQILRSKTNFVVVLEKVVKTIKIANGIGVGIGVEVVRVTQRFD